MLIPIEVVSRFVHENFQKVRVSKGGTHFHARCPLCGDSKKSLSKKRFHLDYNNGVPGYHCFNCERAGSFIQLYSKIKGVTIEDAKRQLIKFDTDFLSQLLHKKKIEDTPIPNGVANHDSILEDCFVLSDEPEGVIEQAYHKKMMDFTRDRKIPSGYPLYMAYKGDYKGRIIIPLMNNGHIIYFQGRAVGNMEPKYLNPPTPKSLTILNKENFDPNKQIIVTEGILDALQLGNQGTCILGRHISDSLISELLNLTHTGIVIVLDNDESGYEEVERFMAESHYSSLVNYFIWPYKYKYTKDLNQLATTVAISDMYNFVIENSKPKFNAQVNFGMRRK